ncbi:MAG: NAD(P)H-hydrate dehydratase [Pseudomonadota bacterium]
MASVVLLTAAQMRAAENAAIKGGVSSAALMENAGQAVAQVAMKGWSKRPVAVICGAGNNGGDGYVVARRLAEAGWSVKLLKAGDHSGLSGDAKMMSGLYAGEAMEFSPQELEGVGLIVDAVFGAGLSRPIEGEAAEIINAINSAAAPALAVDLPSGIHPDTGVTLGVSVQATRTVTFFAKKPGHVLYPGRALCGAVDVAAIGMEPDALSAVPVDTFENQPPLWAARFPRPSWRTHKYDRGHVFVLSGGPFETGAARLAAGGAQRMGAGLVTMLASAQAAPMNAPHLTSVMLRICENADQLSEILTAKAHYNRTLVIGPAAGVSEATRNNLKAGIAAGAEVIADADALTSFAEDAEELFGALRPEDIITPHEGEFELLFPGLLNAGRLPAAKEAAKKAGCVVMLKGADTIIATPDGRAAINVNATPDLATAGAGDVLAGFIAAIRAQGAPGFEAACAGVWFHGAASISAGPGLIAEDLAEQIPSILRTLTGGNSAKNAGS